MKRLAFISVLMLLLVTFSGCHFGHLGPTVSGSGVRKTEKRDLPPFQEIDTTGALNIQVVCQQPESFEIEADDNILPLIQSEVRNGVLHLKEKQGYNSRQGVFVRITVPNLEGFDATGAGKVRISSLKNDKFQVHSTGAATVTVTGETRDLEIHTTGAGTVDAHNLHAQKANVSSTGAAKVEVYATEELEASATGAGHVTYSGNPKTVKKHASGAASVGKGDEQSY